MQAQKYLLVLRRLTLQLKTVSEWSFAPEQVRATVEHGPQALQQGRVKRAVLFMDVRGFTHWSEKAEPEVVVKMLNLFYQTAENIIMTRNDIKPHFVGDAVMTWFVSPQEALNAAVVLRDTLNQQLQQEGLNIGLGLHYGEVVEGLLGTSQTRQFDIIGDAVNTASRLCSAASSGQLLVSSDLVDVLAYVPPSPIIQQVQAKGKSEPLMAYSLT